MLAAGAVRRLSQKGKIGKSYTRLQEIIMSSHDHAHTTNAAHSSPTHAEEQDAVEAIVPLMPVVLPVAGAVLMFLLAFIAIYMA